jgi:hypothetical protein
MIKTIARYSAVMAFFVMSIIGWFCGLSPATCCGRAVPGAIIAYVAVSWAGKTVARIVMDQMIQSKVDEMQQKKQPR